MLPTPVRPTHPNVSREEYLAWIQEYLPKEMLYVLERRWFEVMQAGSHTFSYDGSDVEVGSGFFRVAQIRHGPDAAVSLHPSNMLNVLSSLRDSNHTLVYSVRSDGRDVTLRMGLRRFRDELFGLPTADHVRILQGALRSNFPGIEMSEEIESYGEVAHRFLSPLTMTRSKLACITGIPSLKGDAAALFTQSVDRLVDALRGEEYTLLILAEPIREITEMQDRARQISGEIHTLVRQSIAESQGQSFSKTVNVSHANTISAGLGGVIGTLVGFSLGRTEATGTSEATADTQNVSLSYEKVDKTAQYCEQMLDAFQLRLQRGRNLGFWNVGVFLASSNDSAFLRAQGILRGLYTGHQSFSEPLRMVELTGAHVDIQGALMELCIPRLEWAQKHPLSSEFYGLGTPLATDELAVMMSLPHREVPGLKLGPTADFNLNPPPVEGFRLGTLLYRGENLKLPVHVSAAGLTRHAFVTGLTGAGKTNTCLALLAAAYRDQKVNFLVIDPAKTEYRFLYYADKVKDDLLLFTLGEEMAPFRLNPFEFEPGFPLLGHIDLVKAVFNAAFPMYASMPYLLEEAILAIYEERGWNVAESTNKFLPDMSSPADMAPYLPRLSDLYAKVDDIVSSKRYGAQLTQDLSAALKARLGSLLNGSKGLMLDTPRSTPLATLLNRPVVLELRGIPDEDEKAFIMALLFIRLYEACRGRPLDKRLRHVTLIEEAHRLLRYVPLALSSESANPRGKTVEMFADMMAEMRVYGEGFIVVDQMPSKLIPDVIKGSNLKIVHRLLALEDRVAVGNAMNLSSGQIDELPRLKQGRAVVHSEELEEACLVQIDPVVDGLSDQQSGDTPEAKDRATKAIVRERMARFYGERVELFRRYQACHLCDAPCTYRPEENEPSGELLAWGERFLTALLLGDGNLFGVWRRLDHLLDEALERRHRQGRLPGHDRCARVLLATATAARFYQAHPQASDWPARLELEMGLARLWERRAVQLAHDAALESEVRREIEALRQMMRRRIAFAPATARLGCGPCPVRCLFGHRLQLVNNSAVAPALNRLKDATAEQPPDWTMLRRLAVEQVGLKLSEKAEWGAAYCLITQASADPRLPAEALRRMRQAGGAPTRETR